MTPQWPCEVYSHRQTSVIRRSSGWRARRARSASWTMPSSSYAPEPSSSFSSGMPNSRTARTPSVTSASVSAVRSSTPKRPIAGRSGFASDSGPTKSGMTKSSRSSRVSRTRPRSRSVRRRRRRRVTGKALTPGSLRQGGSKSLTRRRRVRSNYAPPSGRAARSPRRGRRARGLPARPSSTGRHRRAPPGRTSPRVRTGRPR